jgi:hypothetical protein
MAFGVIVPCRRGTWIGNGLRATLKLLAKTNS